jgi:16S rRNA (cytosine967-C5)-methyltransferase
VAEVRRSATQDRARAARTLTAVVYTGKTLDQSFGSDDVSPLLRELVMGSLRYYYSLSSLVDRHLERALKSRDLDLRCLLLVGAYQLRYTRIPDHAAIHETVGACRSLRKPWARALVNGILRNIARDPSTDTEQSFELPSWIENRLLENYPGELLIANLERAQMSLRVNVSRARVEDYAAALHAAELDHRPGYVPENLILNTPIPSRLLPGYQEGLVSIQDPGAMFVPGLLPPLPAGARILDACAAPGGKLFHLAERYPNSKLTGLELVPERFGHLTTEAQRLGHDGIELLTGDATTRDWYEGPPFDVILLDAPCSGTGTLRRHPDIKLLRRESDLEDYAAMQHRLLINLWGILKPGGTFIYCTCSLLREENDAVVGNALPLMPGAQLEPFELPTGTATRHGWQLFPLPAAARPDPPVDGFYFARLTRQ